MAASSVNSKLTPRRKGPLVCWVQRLEPVVGGDRAAPALGEGVVVLGSVLLLVEAAVLVVALAAVRVHMDCRLDGALLVVGVLLLLLHLVLAIGIVRHA